MYLVHTAGSRANGRVGPVDLPGSASSGTLWIWSWAPGKQISSSHTVHHCTRKCASSWRTRGWHDEWWHIPYKISSSFWFMTTYVRKLSQSRLKQNKGDVNIFGPCAHGRVHSQGWEDGKYLLLKDAKCWTWHAFDARDLGAQSLEVRELAWRLV